MFLGKPESSVMIENFLMHRIGLRALIRHCAYPFVSPASLEMETGRPKVQNMLPRTVLSFKELE